MACCTFVAHAKCRKHKSPVTMKITGLVVPKAGLEPAQAIAHCPLKTACLPIPPLRRGERVSTLKARGVLTHPFPILQAENS